MKNLILICGLFLSLQITAQSKNLSISVSEDNDDYSYVAIFSHELTSKVNSAIIKEMGKPNSTGRYTTWESTNYEIELKEGKVIIEYDKKEIPSKLATQLKTLGDKISEALGQPLPKTPKPPKTH